MIPLTILLVEDEPVISLELKLELECDGHNLLTVYDPAAVIRLCERHLPDMAIINFVYINARDGMALARLLRTRFLVPVLFITGARWKDLEKSSYFYAGHEVLYKPFTKLQFRAALNAVLEEVHKLRSV